MNYQYNPYAAPQAAPPMAPGVIQPGSPQPWSVGEVITIAWERFKALIAALRISPEAEYRNWIHRDPKMAAERAGVGAAMIGGIGAGIFKGYDEVRNLAPVFNVITAPQADRRDQYEVAYRRYLDLYPRLKSWF